jgi:hypothetical protein
LEQEDSTMRRILSLITAIVCITATANAKDLTDWRAVQRLKVRTEIVIVTANETVEGRLTGADDREVRIEAKDRSAIGFLTPRTFPRGEVRELYKAGKRLERRITGTQLLLSSAIGAAAGVGIGAAYDSAHRTSEDPGSGKLVFGTLGFFVGPAATAIGRGIYSTTHREKLIYRIPPGSQSRDHATEQHAIPRSAQGSTS